ncbi:hypothetical protein SKAU_G00043890 [Synaphobranchus kaupii]|uniref:Uncharacterized protein n=1 Tax=Synaphobranchus kaupii TaxID=118154 RepID=A0A9Q1G2P2_SYNKA|nr:hypothetical protein SKAU_G00043890 [Synaphobranchus kaupii]
MGQRPGFGEGFIHAGPGKNPRGRVNLRAIAAATHLPFELLSSAFKGSKALAAADGFVLNTEVGDKRPGEEMRDRCERYAVLG